MNAAIVSYPGSTLQLFEAAADAEAQVPPAFPLEASIAVNPYLGQVGEDRATAAARLALTGAGSLFLDRAEVARMIEAGAVTDADLAAAAELHGLSVNALRAAAATAAPDRAPLPTVAELAAMGGGGDWSALAEERLGLWAGTHFDRGQAFWPSPDTSAFEAWKAHASRDLTPAIAGLSGFCERVQALPGDARQAFALACAGLELTPDAAKLYFHRLFSDLGGWAQYARHLSWIAERDGGSDPVCFELLTIRLVWEAAVLEHGGASLAEDWARTRQAYAVTVTPDDDQLLDAALQEAVDRAGERQLAEALAAEGDAMPEVPAIQAAFCIDVRSEVFRRALEAQGPDISTIGFAGFFGLAISHQGYASDIEEARAPILLNPSIGTTRALGDTGTRIHLRAIRAWGRFKRAAVSAFAFVEAAGPLYIGKLVRDALGIAHESDHGPAPILDLPLEDRIDAAEAILRAMSLTSGFARLVLIAGHGSHVTNTPHASAYQCGACGGHAGDVNARALAALLDDKAVREGLVKKGIEIPDTTRFVPGLHDTVSDEVFVWGEALPTTHSNDLARLKRVLSAAAISARTERALTLPRGTAGELAARGADWSELRPEWGLAGCKAFVIGPRGVTRGRDLGGRVFLHDYDAEQDPEDATLEMILSAPAVVASWIALQYHGSSVAPDSFGAGNKLLHNVVGGIGVLEGNGGVLRAGLPMQSVHDGETLRHAPTRLTVVACASTEAIDGVLKRQPDVAALFDNGWLALASMGPDGRLTRRAPGGGWSGDAGSEGRAAA